MFSIIRMFLPEEQIIIVLLALLALQVLGVDVLGMAWTEISKLLDFDWSSWFDFGSWI